MTTVFIKNGQKIQVVAPDEHKLVLTDSDIEMDYRAAQAVKAALHKAQVCKKPIADFFTGC